VDRLDGRIAVARVWTARRREVRRAHRGTTHRAALRAGGTRLASTGITMARRVLSVLASLVVGCSDGDGASPPPAPAGDADAVSDAGSPPAVVDASHEGDDDVAQARAPEAGPDAPSCKKEIVVLFSVGTGAGALAAHSNGCWSVVDADGAANKAFRKCSTSNDQVKNSGAPNYAYDDTNPDRPLDQDKTFLAQCSAGATGDGFEYMAYRGGWRFLGATHLKAYFAELYGDGIDDVDSLWSQPGVYQGNAEIKAHQAYPMMNVGPSPGAGLEKTIEAEGLAICKTIPDHGYFGTYVATWDQPMGPTDARVLALAKALDDCTKK
jgi:hypothetical protein